MNQILRDEVSTIILTDVESKDFVAKIISLVANLDYNTLKDKLVLDSNRINNNVNTKYSKTDALYHNDDYVFNVEINTIKSMATEMKNFRYICQLLLKQVKPGEKDEYQKIIQINLSDYDYFEEGKFIYESFIMEKTSYKRRSELITIFDISLEYLRSLDYNTLKKEDTNSLKRILYLFICEDDKKRNELYSKDEIMDKINNKLNELKSDFDDLYIDREEYKKAAIYEVGQNEGIAKGKEERNIEIAKKLLLKSMPIKEIADITDLSIEEIKELQKEK